MDINFTTYYFCGSIFKDLTDQEFTAWISNSQQIIFGRIFRIFDGSRNFGLDVKFTTIYFCGFSFKDLTDREISIKCTRIWKS